MDNSGGHELNVNLDGVSIIYLPRNSTSKHQPLDLGLSESAFKINLGRGKWGLEEGQLPHVADAIKLFNKAWSLTSHQYEIKCWLKCEIIGVNQLNQLRSILNGTLETENDVDSDLTGGNRYNSSTSLDDSEIINSSMVKNIEEAIQASKFTYQGPNSAITSMIEEATGSVIESKDCKDISAVLNSPALYDDEPVRYNFQDTECLEMLHKSKSGKFSELEATNPESEGSSIQCTDLTEMRKCIDKMKTVTGDVKLLEALPEMERRPQELEYENDE